MGPVWYGFYRLISRELGVPYSKYIELLFCFSNCIRYYIVMTFLIQAYSREKLIAIQFAINIMAVSTAIIFTYYIYSLYIWYLVGLLFYYIYIVFWVDPVTSIAVTGSTQYIKIRHFHTVYDTAVEFRKPLFRGDIKVARSVLHQIMPAGEENTHANHTNRKKTQVNRERYFLAVNPYLSNIN